MSDISQGDAAKKCGKQEGEGEEKVPVIRMKLKDREYRKLCNAARACRCTPEELVERCVRQLLDA